MFKKLLPLFILFFIPAIARASVEEELPSQDSMALVEEPKPATTEEIKSAISFEPFTGCVKGNRVRLRASPTLEGYVVKEINAGDFVAVTGEVRDFYAIRPSKATKGFVFRTFVFEDVVEGDRVNIRLYPDIDGPVIGQLNAGDKIKGVVSAVNNKWIEIDLPESAAFYIAKEYIENSGPVELYAKHEARHNEGRHLLSTTFLYAQSEIQKPFEEINLDQVNQKFEELVSGFPEFTDIVEKAKEINGVIQEAYVQKKIAFLESKADRSTASLDKEFETTFQKLVQFGNELQVTVLPLAALEESKLADIALTSSVTSATTILESPKQEESKVTDKMLVWQPVEDFLYHLWAAVHEDRSIAEFYQEEEQNAAILTGIIEPYTKPTKNRPGDFILKSGNLTIAFLYSTKINLQEKIGQKVTVVGVPRPNNNFAFPAYFVLAVE